MFREVQQECFRALVSRFSRDVWRKEAIQLRKASSDAVCNNQEMEQGLVQYRKKLVSQHFAFDLTRMAGEMIKVGGGHDAFPILPGSHLHLGNPVLEFIKNVMQVLRLDSSVEKEVNALNRSLLSQIGVQEYDPSTKWKNPCADFVLPDVFCSECHECRDVNLCVLPNFEYDEKEVNISFVPDFFFHDLNAIIGVSLVISTPGRVRIVVAHTARMQLNGA